jgi:hypothetical protein
MNVLFYNAIKARNDINASFFGHNLGLDLVTHGNDRSIGRTDEGDAVFLELSCEFSILGEETVSGMNSLCSSFLLNFYQKWIPREKQAKSKKLTTVLNIYLKLFVSIRA